MNIKPIWCNYKGSDCSNFKNLNPICDDITPCEFINRHLFKKCKIVRPFNCNNGNHTTCDRTCISCMFNIEEKINHPPHYGGKEYLFEPIKIIEAWNLNFHLGNCIKYIGRYGKKEGNKIEDLEKALWYLSREIDNRKHESK